MTLLESFHNFQEVYENNSFRIYRHREHGNNDIYKMTFTTDFPLLTTARAITSMHLYKNWHPQIEEAEIKLKISSENSFLIYQQVKSYSEWYRDREYLVLLHAFVDKEDVIDGHPTACYLVGKSIENTNYVPLLSLTRGNIDYMVWKIEEFKGNANKSKVKMELKIDHRGLLNTSHQN